MSFFLRNSIEIQVCIPLYWKHKRKCFIWRWNTKKMCIQNTKLYLHLHPYLSSKVCWTIIYGIFLHKFHCCDSTLNNTWESNAILKALAEFPIGSKSKIRKMILCFWVCSNANTFGVKIKMWTKTSSTK